MAAACGGGDRRRRGSSEAMLSGTKQGMFVAFWLMMPPLPPTSSPTLPPPGCHRAAAAVRSLIVCSPWWASAATRHAALPPPGRRRGVAGGVVACLARWRLWPRRCRGAWPLCSSWQEQLPGGALRAVLQYTVGMMLNTLVFLSEPFCFGMLICYFWKHILKCNKIGFLCYNNIYIEKDNKDLPRLSRNP